MPLHMNPYIIHMLLISNPMLFLCTCMYSYDVLITTQTKTMKQI